jgi:hypothetical protein
MVGWSGCPAVGRVKAFEMVETRAGDEFEVLGRGLLRPGLARMSVWAGNAEGK